MNKIRLMGIVVVIIMMVAVIAATNLNNATESKRVHQHLQYINIEGIADDFDEGQFSTHLPLVIIDINGQQIGSGDGRDAYIPVEIKIIDNESAYNHVSDAFTLQSKALIKYRGQSSLHFEKKQYSIKFITEDGRDNKVSVLGMGADEEWVLNGSYIDKSLLRNYLPYNIAGEIMAYAPNVRFTEVILRDGEIDTYQGVYLLIESVKRHEDRVSITKYNPKQTFSSFLIRRDRFRESEIMLQNYGTVEGLTENFIGLRYPIASKVTDETIEYIQNYISKFEKALYSTNNRERQTYSQYIDVASFVDYFVINEFFANYDAGLHSTYAYKDLGEKLYMGPVWDFDGALDNYNRKALDVEFTVLNDRSWFDALVKDRAFVDKVIKRYRQLRKGILSEDYVFQYIDDTVVYLGDAIERNNGVWGNIYNRNRLADGIDKEGNVIERNAPTYGAEIERIKKVIHEHGTWLDEHIDYLYMFSDYNSSHERDLLAVLFVAIFFIIIILVQRK